MNMLKKNKPQEIQKLKELINSHEVVGVLDMYKLPGRQLYQMRNNFKGKATIRMSRKNLLLNAASESNKPHLKEIIEKVEGPPALIVGNDDSFKLYKMIKSSRVKSKAKVGDRVDKEIVIPKGPTNLPPGPAISTLQKVGLKSMVQQGKIAIGADKTVLKAGDTVSDDVANVFNLLGIEPMEIGLTLVACYEKGIVYSKDVLDVDPEEYVRRLSLAIQHTINLSIEIGYITDLTARIVIQKAFREARSLCIETGIMEKEFIDEILVKAIREANALEENIPKEENKSEVDKK